MKTYTFNEQSVDFLRELALMVRKKYLPKNNINDEYRMAGIILEMFPSPDEIKKVEPLSSVPSSISHFDYGLSSILNRLWEKSEEQTEVINKLVDVVKNERKV